MRLEIYFDYLCEFCEKGRVLWTRLLPKYPGIQPVWKPCEAHPRASEPRYGMHSDLAIQGMFFLQAHGADVALYNQELFAAAWHRGEWLEDLPTLARYAEQAGGDAAAFTAHIKNGVYSQALHEANRHAWSTLGLQAVPSFLLEDGRRLDAVLGVGVTEQRLEQFLLSASR